MTQQVTDTLQSIAKRAAEAWVAQVESDREWHYWARFQKQDGFIAGYLSATEAADQEIARLQEQLTKTQRERDEAYARETRDRLRGKLAP